MPPSFIVEGAPIDIYVIGSQGPRGRDAATTVVTGDFTAENDYQYNVTATAIATDPTGVSGKGYTVFVINGSATVGGVTYSTEGSIIRRYYKSGAWYSKLYRDSTAYAAAVHTHTLAAGATDVTITAANLNTLDDGANSSLHFHNSDRDRANHTGTQLAATISDFNAAVAAVAPNAVTSATSSDGTCALSVASLSSVGVVSTSGSTAYIRTTGTDAFISTSGSGAYIRTSGANAGISTTGANASIFTSGANAGISTTGGGNISTSGTFRITAGEFVTTLSGTQTANRSISYPDASGTVALTSDITDSVTSATTSDGTCNLTVATLNGLTVSTSSGILTVITNSTLISSNGSASARGAIAVDGAINTMAGGSFTTGTGNLTGPNTDGTLALTSDITDSITSATTSDGTALLDIARLTAETIEIEFGANVTTLSTAMTTSRDIVFPDASGILVIGGGTASGTNTGDNAVNSLYSGLVSNATHTGDATGATALTLATVNSNVGTFGSATQSVSLTVNGKGLVTAASAVTITPAVGSITGLGTGVSTALAIATGSAGAIVLNGGTATNMTLAGTLTINSTSITYGTGAGLATLKAEMDSAGLGFINQQDEFLAVNNVGGTIGSLGWGLSGGTTIGFLGNEIRHPGITRLSGTATAGIYLNYRSTVADLANCFDGVTIEGCFRLNAITNCKMIFGIGVVATYLTNGFRGIVFDPSQSANWRLLHRTQANADTFTDTTKAAVAGDWVYVKLVIASGVTTCTISTTTSSTLTTVSNSGAVFTNTNAWCPQWYMTISSGTQTYDIDAFLMHGSTTRV